MAVTDVSKYETVSTELWTKIKPDLTRPKISSGIDWDGLFELKVKSWPTLSFRHGHPFHHTPVEPILAS